MTHAWSTTCAAQGVPFLDAVTTMLDETIPLTIIEWWVWEEGRGFQSQHMHGQAVSNASTALSPTLPSSILSLH